MQSWLTIHSIMLTLQARNRAENANQPCLRARASAQRACVLRRHYMIFCVLRAIEILGYLELRARTLFQGQNCTKYQQIRVRIGKNYARQEEFVNFSGLSGFNFNEIALNQFILWLFKSKTSRKQACARKLDLSYVLRAFHVQNFERVAFCARSIFSLF